MSGQDDDKAASPESFTIDFDDDLLSAALAAVDARAEESKRTRKAADPTEMAEIEASIEVDEIDLGEDGIVVGGEATVHEDSPSLLAEGIDLDALVSEVSEALEVVGPEAQDISDDDQGNAEAAELAARIEELEQRYGSMRNKARHWRNEARSLEAQAERTQQQLDRTKGELENLREARQVAEGRATKFKQALEDSHQNLEKLLQRHKKEREETTRYGHGSAVLEILPVLDNLELALQHADDAPETALEGVQMIASQFHAALQGLGIQRVDASPGSPFDPEVHEAMVREPSDEVDPGCILSEIGTGFLLHDKLLRAARVTVAMSPGEEAVAPSQKEAATTEAEDGDSTGSEDDS